MHQMPAAINAASYFTKAGSTMRHSRCRLRNDPCINSSSCSLSFCPPRRFSFLPSKCSDCLGFITVTDPHRFNLRPPHLVNRKEEMEHQTIRERRFGSLSLRRKQKDAVATTIYEPMNKAPVQANAPVNAETKMSTSTQSTASSPSSSPDINASTSVETLSDISVTTPSGIPVMVSDMKRQTEANNVMIKAPALKLTMPSMPKETTPTSPKPVLVSSLSKRSDFSFDRYSRVIDIPDFDDVEILEVSEAACSPIEVATPITYIKPNRPSMVSIFNILDKGSIKEAAKPVLAKPNVPTRNPERPTAKRLSTVSTRSGFMAGEATRFEVPDLPYNALTMISNASQTDISTMTRHQEPTLKKQKSSMTLLSKAFKYGHSRMTSRAQSVSPSPSQTTPQNHHRALSSMPSPAPRARLPPTPSSLPQPPQSQHLSSKSVSSRPQTAVPSASPPQAPLMTALPPCIESVSPRPPQLLGHTSRKKSLSALRSRSDSIGKSLLSMAHKSSLGRSQGRNLASETPPFPGEVSTPVLVTPRKSSVDLNAFPTPPLPSRPQSNRGSIMSFSRPLTSSTMPLRGLGVTVN